MRKILDQYIENIGKNSYINNKDDIYFYIDNLLFYKLEYQKLSLEIDNSLNQSIEEAINKGGLSEHTKDTIFLDVNRKKGIYNNIKSFFVLFILETAKILEVDSNFKSQLDKNICIIHYDRLYRGKEVKIETISNQIIHFRDAFVHHRDKEISKWPEFKKLNISKDLYLEPAHDYKTRTPVFMVGHGILSFETIEKIIKEICGYYSVKIQIPV